MAEVNGEIRLRMVSDQGEDFILVLDANQLRQQLWEKSPAFLTNPQSEERQKHQSMVMMAKPVMRGMLDSVLKGLFGDAAPRVPREADVFQYAASLLINIVVGGLVANNWQLRVQDAEVGSETVYRVVELTSSPKVTDGEQTAHGEQHASQITA